MAGTDGGSAALIAESLSKRFGSLQAVDAVTLRVGGGELFGFLGANGAGKTTTLKMLAGLLRPDAGRIAVAGYDIRAAPLQAKAVLGYMPDPPYLYEKLTGREYVDFIADIYRVPGGAARQERIAGLLRLLDLADAGDDLVEGYSHGMRQKIALAAMLLHDPQVFLLDEPTNGLDPRSRRVVREILTDLARRGKTVLLSTHILEVAQAMCDRVAIIDKGRIVATGTLDELRRAANLGGASSLEDIFLSLTGGAEYGEW
ncbi:MAG TPA: ABC transporter ATP-binding protein [Chloroflexia bacterium]|nr:ABC transporter ATP-binding protein [Chloroflexia bacterium]